MLIKFISYVKVYLQKINILSFTQMNNLNKNNKKDFK